MILNLFLKIDHGKLIHGRNQKYFIKFLNKYKLSKLYAYGSYYYLLYKILIKDLNFNLFLSYMIFYPTIYLRNLLIF